MKSKLKIWIVWKSRHLSKDVPSDCKNPVFCLITDPKEFKGNLEYKSLPHFLRKISVLKYLSKNGTDA